MAIENKIEITFNAEDLDKLVLELHGQPIYERLQVYIRDPINPVLYWYRSINIKNSKLENGVLKFERYGEGSILEKLTYTESKLQNKIQQGRRDNPETVVGIARYNGTNQLSLNQILGMAALKYYQIRAGYPKGKS